MGQGHAGGGHQARADKGAEAHKAGMHGQGQGHARRDQQAGDDLHLAHHLQRGLAVLGHRQAGLGPAVQPAFQHEGLAVDAGGLEPRQGPRQGTLDVITGKFVGFADIDQHGRTGLQAGGDLVRFQGGQCPCP